MYSHSPTLSQISLKKFFGKVVFQILAKMEMSRNKNRLFGRHFETVQHFQIFFAEIVIFYSPYIYGANFIAKVRWENGFLKDGTPPWAPTGVKVPWSLKCYCLRKPGDMAKSRNMKVVQIYSFLVW